MTHRDRAGDPSDQRAGRREAAGDPGSASPLRQRSAARGFAEASARHRQGFPTPTGGSPARPERRLPKAFGLRRTWLPMSRTRLGEAFGGARVATPRAPGRKPWETVSMGHYQRSVVLRGARAGPHAPRVTLTKH